MTERRFETTEDGKLRMVFTLSAADRDLLWRIGAHAGPCYIIPGSTERIIEDLYGKYGVRTDDPEVYEELVTDVELGLRHLVDAGILLKYLDLAEVSYRLATHPRWETGLEAETES